MKKRVNPSDFNFDESEEVKIYTYMMYKELRNKKGYKKLKEQYFSYDEWKLKHAYKLYEHITLKSLIDVRRMFIRKLENSRLVEGKFTGIIIPTIVLMFSPFLSYINNYALNPLFTYVISLSAIIWIIYGTIVKMRPEDIKKNLYKDYIEIINELIVIRDTNKNETSKYLGDYLGTIIIKTNYKS